MRVLVVWGICWFGLAAALAWSWSVPHAQEPHSILRCYHDGAIIAEAPIPAPPDFRVQMSGSAVTSAQWTMRTGQKVVMVSSAPCLYFVRQPDPAEIGASGHRLGASPFNRETPLGSEVP
jgi:hypothetical protein